jgi:hypothetical protein
MHNEWSCLASRLEYEWGFLGGPKLLGKEKEQRRREMESDGGLFPSSLDRLKELEKAIKTRDIKFLHDYDNKGYIRQYNPEYGKPVRQYNDYDDYDL